MAGRRRLCAGEVLLDSGGKGTTIRKTLPTRGYPEMRTFQVRASSVLVTLLFLAGPGLARAQTGAASDHRPRHRPERSGGGGRHGDRDQPGHERRVHRRLQRGRQLHDHLGPRGDLRGQGRALQLQDLEHEADPARGEADRAPGLPHGAGRARGHGRGHGGSAGAADRVGDGGRGHLGEHRPVAAAQRAQRGPARAPPAGDHDLQPPRLHQHRQREHEPPVRERESRADQQLHGRRPGRERDDRQPRRLPAESRRARRDQRGDEQLRGRRRQRRGRRDQQRHQVRREPVPRQRLRVLPEQRLRREHLGEQPLRRAPPGTQAAHLRRPPSAGRSSRTTSSSSPTTRARARTRRARPRPRSRPRRGGAATSRASAR